MALNMWNWMARASGAQADEPSGERWGGDGAHEHAWAEARGEIAAVLALAAARIEDDPDEAAWLLDGALGRVIALWLAVRGVAVGQEGALAAVERADAVFAMRVRLALRAPNAPARLAQCQDLLCAAVADGALDEASAGLPSYGRRSIERKGA